MLKPSVELHQIQGVLVAEFWDCLRLDPMPVSELRERYDKHIEQKGAPEIVVDLSGVGFAGSASLGHLVALQRKARQNGGRLVLCNVDPTVLEVLRARKLASLFDMAKDRETAIQAVKRLRETKHEPGKEVEAGLLPRDRGVAGGSGSAPPLRRRRNSEAS
jgi:anti-anti-sigma factor